MNQIEPHDLDAREQLARALAFLRRASRLWPIPLATLLVAAIACAGYMRLRKPRYRSETVVLYVEKGSSADTNEPANGSRTTTMRLKELLLSRPTLERAITTHDLYPELRREFGLGEAVEEFKKHVEFRAPGGDTVSVAFEGSSPNEAQHVTAQLAQDMVDGDAELRRQQARVALDFLVGEKTNTETQLRNAEQALAAFMAQHPRFALDATPLASGTAIRASLAGAKSGAAGGELPRVSSGPLLGVGNASAGSGAAVSGPASAQAAESKAAEARARAAVATARDNLNQQLAQYTPAHPDVRAAQAELAHATERLAALESNAPPPAAAPAPAGGEQPAAAPARRVWSAPAAAPAPRASDTKELVALETQWLKLTQAVTEAHERQDQVDAQWFKADLLASSETAGRGVQVSVIDPAYLPQREQPPSRTLLVVIFAGAGLLLGLGAALIGAAFDDRLIGAADLAGMSPLLVEIPAISAERRQRDAT